MTTPSSASDAPPPASLAGSSDDLHAFALGLAHAAGRAILPHFRVPIAIEDKGRAGGYDPVTEADKAAETVIRDGIAARFPGHGVRGEEHGWNRGREPSTWVIDPIDGTRSFILGQMHWATLIAVNDGERVQLGVAHQPYVGETFHATADGPALWSRGGEQRTLATRRCPRLADAALACTDPLMFRSPEELDAFRRVSKEARLTRYGGDCYAYCLLAMGLIDVVVESGLQAWDVQALIPVVERAGGIITSWTGGRCDEGGAVVACGDPGLHAAVLDRLAGR